MNFEEECYLRGIGDRLPEYKRKLIAAAVRECLSVAAESGVWMVLTSRELNGDDYRFKSPDEAREAIDAEVHRVIAALESRNA